MHVYIYIYISLSLWLCVFVCMHTDEKCGMHVPMHVSMNACVYVCMHAYIHMCVCRYTLYISSLQVMHAKEIHASKHMEFKYIATHQVQ